jgi:histidine triad (HIT) family protein
MAEETIFRKIIDKEIPSDTLYQDEYVTAFRDISPQAPTHISVYYTQLRDHETGRNPVWRG